MNYTTQLNKKNLQILHAECPEADDPYPRSCLHPRAFPDLLTTYLFCSSSWHWDYLILFIQSSSRSFKDFVILMHIDENLPLNSIYAFLGKQTLSFSLPTMYFLAHPFSGTVLFLCPQFIPFSFTQSQHSARGIFGVMGDTKYSKNCLQRNCTHF